MTADVHSGPHPRRSPLEHLAGELAAAGGAATVHLTELAFLHQLEVRGVAATRLAAVAATHTLLWLGPGWHLLVGESGESLEPLLRKELGDEHYSVVDVSAARTVLQLNGPRARDVLAHGCSLDLHPEAFPVGGCAQTNLAKAQVVLHRPGPDRYHVFVRASFADYLARWLLDALVEYVTAAGAAA
ncbi:sarcosine oxidase subunit gamma [Dactylosporangium sp. NBC_01737]|uniref:sarcosine oxidase subunit gamma n=1 Tax=Dactylosporangium sp. NBC_01737 TaxID=2975959 RepID=UPI002E1137A5|nr:sarcosine oxidase subunit gamma [Dactylosporangium sp. NBC_01737]